MDTKLQYYIMKYIQSNSDISSLTAIGYSYIDIAHAYSKMLNDGYFEPDKEGKHVVLSEKGEIQFELLRRKKSIAREIHIEPYEKYRIPKMGLYDIFLS